MLSGKNKDNFIDVQLIIKNPSCPLANIENIKVNILDIRGVDNYISHLIETSKDDYYYLHKVVKDESLTIIESSEELNRKSGKCLARIVSKGCNVCRTLATGGAFLVSGKLMGDGSMAFRFITPNKMFFHRILSKFTDENIRYSVVSVKKLEGKPYLTKKQEKVLILALRLGLFEHPRRITINELAKMLGIQPSTLTEIIRRGIKKILKELLYT